MTTYRFFVPADWLKQDSISLSGALVHQIRDVLRIKPGEQIVALDDSGWEYQVELDKVEKDEVAGHILHKALAGGEPRTKITLYQGVLKGHHFEWVLQKGTEIGIVEFVPVICDRCLMSSLGDISAAKIARWQRIIREAAEQCRRGRLPRLQSAMLLPQACDQTRQSGLNLMPWEEERKVTLRNLLQRESQISERAAHAQGRNARRPFSIGLMIGPEGGFTPEEVELARRYNIHTLSLGTRILRAETAGLVAAAAILYEFGDLA